MMTVDAVSFIAPLALPATTPTQAASPAPTVPFGAWLAGEVAQVNDRLLIADGGIRQLAAGEASNLHQVMISLEEARLSLQLVMQVRNHALDAYRELLQMQV